MPALRGAGGSRTHDGGFAIRCLSHLATAPDFLIYVLVSRPASLPARFQSDARAMVKHVAVSIQKQTAIGV